MYLNYTAQNSIYHALELEDIIKNIYDGVRRWGQVVGVRWWLWEMWLVWDLGDPEVKLNISLFKL